MTIKVEWADRVKGEQVGELHSFIQTPAGIMGMVITSTGEFVPIPGYELRVTDVKTMSVFKKAKKA